MIIKEFKSVVMILIFALSVSFQAFAATTTDEIALRVKNGIEEKLQLDKVKDASTLNKIHKNIRLISSAITASKLKGSIDDDVANWLIDGIVRYVSSIEIRRLSVVGDDYINGIAKHISHLFESSEKTNNMLRYSKLLLKEAAVYRGKYQSYLVRQFLASKYIKIRLASRGKGMYLGGFHIGSIANLLANASMQNEDKGSAQSYDASNNEIDSRILTLSIIKYFNGYFKLQKERDEYSYASCMSTIFTDSSLKHPAKELNFHDALPYINSRLNRVFRKKKSILLISVVDLSMVLYPLMDIREPQVYTKKIPSTKSMLGMPGGFYVKFHNYKEAWKLIILNDSNIETQETSEASGKQ